MRHQSRLARPFFLSFPFSFLLSVCLNVWMGCGETRGPSELGSRCGSRSKRDRIGERRRGEERREFAVLSKYIPHVHSRHSRMLNSAGAARPLGIVIITNVYPTRLFNCPFQWKKLIFFLTEHIFHVPVLVECTTLVPVHY